MRQPFNILVFPFFIEKDKSVKYALFKRCDVDVWQGIAGGVENNEKMIEAAIRESFEEARIPNDSEFISLDSTSSIPATVFNCHLSWGEDVYVVKEVSFGVRLNKKELEISAEHKSYKWVSYEDAIELLKWDSNKVALWELNQRLLNGRVLDKKF